MKHRSKQFLSILLGLALLLGLMMGMSTTAYADGVPQSGENKYVRYCVVDSYGFDVRGINESGGEIPTTFGNGGYLTQMKVGDNEQIRFNSFSYGEPYTSNDVTAFITARVRGKNVEITYTLTNSSNEAKTVRIGSSADTQIGSNDNAPCSFTENGIKMTDGTLEFQLIPGGGNFTTRWYGSYYDDHSSKVFTNREDPGTFSGDSAIAWSWTIDIPAGATVTKTAVLSAGQAGTTAIIYDANGGTGEMEPTVEVPDGTTKVILEKNTFTWEGHVFQGWDTDSAGKTVVYADEAELVMPDADMTLYAVWKENREITATAEGFEGAYDGKEHGITVTVTDPSSGATIKYGKTAGTYDLDASPTITNVVDSPLTVYFKVTADGYKDYTGSATVTITAADPAKLTPTLVPPTAKQNLIYTGAAQELIDAGSVTGGKLYYAVTLEQTAPADDKYDLVIPAAVEANTYYVWYKVVGDEGYSDIAPAFVPVLIAQGAFVGAPSNDALVYNGAAQALLKAGSTTFGTMAYAMGVDSVTVPTEGWSAVIPTAVNAGEYFVWYQIPGDKNHKGVDPACVRAVIAPKPIAVYAEPKAKFVGEADPALTWTVTGLLDGDTLQGALARDPGEAPGDYAINIGTLTAGPNYEIAFTGAMLTISAQPEPQAQEMFFVTLKTSGNTGFEANWTPRAGADGYDVYCGRCENGKMKLKATVKGGNVLSAKIKKLKKGKMYKVYVQAWTGTPDDKTLLGGQSTTAHAIAGGHSARWTNAKKITVKKPYVGLKPGETAKIKGKITKSKPGKDLLDHIKYYRYYTDNPAVATVDDSGNITAVGYGHCTIYVMTHNGLRANVNVAVSETPAWIIFKKDAYTLKKKQSVSLADQFTLEPAGSITGPIEWTSSEPGLVSVDENGTVKALKKTKKTVTITASAGGAVGTVRIKVKTK